MGNGSGDGKDKERIVNFALLIQQTAGPKGIQYHVESQNQGLADSEIILIVKAWLEKVEENFKNKFKDSLSFGNKGKK